MEQPSCGIQNNQPPKAAFTTVIQTIPGFFISVANELWSLESMSATVRLEWGSIGGASAWSLF